MMYKFLLEARVATRGIYGVFHSHPISETTPSTGDILAMQRFGHAMIYDVIGDEFRLWRVTNWSWHIV